MLLSITTTHRPATDLGYLLVKHPDRVQEMDLPFGRVRVFYPRAEREVCTATMLLDLDPVGLVRGRGEETGPLAQYVNDRPYVANSFLSVAMARLFGTAMAGTSKGRPDLAATPIPLVAEVPVLRSRGGIERIHACFSPLGYQVEAAPLALDPHFPEWGESPYAWLRVAGTVRLSELLAHLYVLLPAIDGDKHYFVGEAEVDKLVDRGGQWLADHPEREWIVGRYLKRRTALTRAALARLLDKGEEDLDEEEAAGGGEAHIERPLSLDEQRIGAVLGVLRGAGSRSVLDLGCGEGKLVGELMKDRRFERITGMDVSVRALQIAGKRLRLDDLPPLQRGRIALLQGALTYRDERLRGYAAACAVEVVEHLDPPRLPAFERAVFEFAQPALVVVTTPNAEYNAKFPNLEPGRFRHLDHRFEWSRAQFREWAAGVAERNGYRVRVLPIGPEDAALGAPTPMGVFER